jgi:putative transposase
MDRLSEHESESAEKTNSAYQGPIIHKAVGKILTQLDIEIVKRSDQANGFVVLPRLLGSIGVAGLPRNLNVKALAFLRFASIRLMLRRLCNPS